MYATLLEGRTVGRSVRGGNENPVEGSELEGSPVPREQYQERFWRRRLDGLGLDTVNKELLAIEFKRTQDARSKLMMMSFICSFRNNKFYVEKAIAVAQEQYTSLLTGLQAVGQVKGVEGTTPCVCRRDVRICSC